MTIQLVANGKPRTATGEQTVDRLLAEWGVDPQIVAVELRGRVLERAAFATEVARNGDTIEIVRMIGGG